MTGMWTRLMSVGAVLGTGLAVVSGAAGWDTAHRLLVHDLLLVPAVLLVGLAVRRLPTALQPSVRAALIVSGTLALTSVPLLLGYGRSTQPGNISLLPGDYPRNLAITTGAVWAAAAIWALVRRGR